MSSYLPDTPHAGGCRCWLCIDRENRPRRTELAQHDPTPDDTKVICPGCCHQFRAIPVQVQQLMLAAGFEPPFTAAPTGQPSKPIDMILHCPQCQMQHIDAPTDEWSNPPHRSHLCHACGHIWRQADVPTNGVAAVKTKGSRDSGEPEQQASMSDATGAMASAWFGTSAPGAVSRVFATKQQAPTGQQSEESPVTDKSHPRFLAGYDAGLHDMELERQSKPLSESEEVRLAYARGWKHGKLAQAAFVADKRKNQS